MVYYLHALLQRPAAVPNSQMAGMRKFTSLLGDMDSVDQALGTLQTHCPALWKDALQRVCAAGGGDCVMQVHDHLAGKG